MHERLTIICNVLSKLEFLCSILGVLCSRTISIVDSKNWQLKVLMQRLWLLVNIETILCEKRQFFTKNRYNEVQINKK